MTATRIKDFTQGNIPKQLAVFAWPLFLSNLLQVVYNMVDMIIVGNHLGRTGISAVSVGGDVAHFLTFVAMGFSSAGQRSWKKRSILLLKDCMVPSCHGYCSVMVMPSTATSVSGKISCALGRYSSGVSMLVEKWVSSSLPASASRARAAASR